MNHTQVNNLETSLSLPSETSTGIIKEQTVIFILHPALIKIAVY